MGLYDINFTDFVLDYLPPDKREPVNKSFITALLAPVQTLHDDTFFTFKPLTEEQTKHNGQRILMESILNNTFGVTAAPLIYIDNSGDNITPNDLFNESEGLTPLFLFNESEGQAPTYFYNESEVTNNREFIVYVPAAVYASVGEDAIKTEIDRLRPYSTFYTILQY